MDSKRVAVIVGNAAEAIRLAPFLRAHARRAANFECVTLVAGPDRAAAVMQLAAFAVVPAREIAFEGNVAFPCELAGRGLTRLGGVLLEIEPDLLLVGGASDTAASAVLAAYHLGIPSVTIDEGPAAAEPEDGRRRGHGRLVAHLAAVHAVPYPRRRLMLAREGVASEGIVVTGAAVIDAYAFLGRQAPRQDISHLVSVLRDSEGPLLVMEPPAAPAVEEARQCAGALRDLIERFSSLRAVLPVTPAAPLLPEVREVLRGLKRVQVLDTSVLFDRLQLLKRASLVLSAGEALRVEAAAVSTPSLALPDGRRQRPKTRDLRDARKTRPATDPEEGLRFHLTRRVRRLLSDPVGLRTLGGESNPYGDGKAGPRLLLALTNFLAGEYPLLCADQEFQGAPARTEADPWEESTALLPSPALLST